MANVRISKIVTTERSPNRSGGVSNCVKHECRCRCFSKYQPNILSNYNQRIETVTNNDPRWIDRLKSFFGFSRTSCAKITNNSTLRPLNTLSLVRCRNHPPSLTPLCENSSINNNLQPIHLNSSNINSFNQHPSECSQHEIPYTNSQSKCIPMHKNQLNVKKCYREGKLTRNPFFNYLRLYRKEHCGYTIIEIAKYGAKEWNKMSDCEKWPFIVEAYRVQKGGGYFKDEDVCHKESSMENINNELMKDKTILHRKVNGSKKKLINEKYLKSRRKIKNNK